jgi:hypothetical protein
MTSGHSLWWMPIVGALLGVIGGGFSNLVLQAKTRWDERRSYSKFGISVIDSLLEKMNTGLNVLWSKNPIAFILTASWYGVETIPNNVLLRIIAVSNNIDSHNSGFLVSHVRIHCKNYISHICVNVNDLIRQRGAAATQSLSNEIQPRSEAISARYAADTENVIHLLNEIKSRLEANSRRRFPK